MELPWRRAARLQKELESKAEKISELEEELGSLRDRLEAEQERRRKLSREKQEAQEKVNRLEDRVRSLKSTGQENEVDEHLQFRDMGLSEVREFLSRVETYEGDSVQISINQSISELEDTTGLRDELGRKYSELKHLNSCLVFHAETLFTLCLKMRPFFRDGWRSGRGFEMDEIRDFISTRKTWVLVSAGDTEILEEKGGEIMKSERVRSRVDHDHSKGGFSQGRFQEKRKKQVSEHLEEVAERLDPEDTIYLLGEERLCKELPGERLGGFDPNSEPPDQLYAFRLARL